jgi:hypothetical protein
MSNRSDPCGNRTHLAAVKKQHPETNRRTGQINNVRSRTIKRGLEGARILVCWSSASRYTISATNPIKTFEKSTKKARCLATPGLGKLVLVQDQVSQAQGVRIVHSFTNRQTRKRITAFLFVIHT